jgi:hypothetical protein
MTYSEPFLEVKFQVLMAVSMKMTVFSDFHHVVWWKVTDVSEVLTASIIRTVSKESSP